MSSRNMCLLPRATLRSDSEQFSLFHGLLQGKIDQVLGGLSGLKSVGSSGVGLMELDMDSEC